VELCRLISSPNAARRGAGDGRTGFARATNSVASADLLLSIIANGTTALPIILAMTIGLILPRILLERFLPFSPPQQPRDA
jgi:hypothetical protein